MGPVWWGLVGREDGEVRLGVVRRGSAASGRLRFGLAGEGEAGLGTAGLGRAGKGAVRYDRTGRGKAGGGLTTDRRVSDGSPAVREDGTGVVSLWLGWPSPGPVG